METKLLPHLERQKVFSMLSDFCCYVCLLQLFLGSRKSRTRLFLRHCLCLILRNVLQPFLHQLALFALPFSCFDPLCTNSAEQAGRRPIPGSRWSRERCWAGLSDQPTRLLSRSISLPAEFISLTSFFWSHVNELDSCGSLYPLY